MKHTARILTVLAVAGLVGLVWPSALLAGGGHRGHHHGGHHHDGHWGFYGGYGGAYWGGWDNDWWWGLSIPLALSFTWANSEPVRVYEPPRVEYRPAPQPAAVVYPPPPGKSPEDLMLEYARSKRAGSAAVESPAPESAGDDSSAGEPLTLAELKKLAAAGVGDQVIISQVRAAGVVFRLTTAEILDLKASGLSDKVIAFLVDTAQTATTAPANP